ncbi:MAG: DsrE family protein, partial [Rhodospirillales bacterium]
KTMGRMSMSTINRRTALVSVLAAGAAGVSTRAGIAQTVLKPGEIKKEADVACIYHCDFGEPARFAQMLNNISNHYSVYGSNPFEIQLITVVHSVGVKFFLDDLNGTNWKGEAIDPALFERVAGLAKNGLTAYLCEITFQRLKLDRAKVRKADFIRFVPSGVATVAALQAKGFAYLKVG